MPSYTQINELISESCDQIKEVCTAFKKGLIDEDKLTDEVTGAAFGIKTAGLHAKNLILEAYIEELNRKNEERRRVTQILKKETMQLKAHLKPPHPERVIYSGERDAWDALFILNKASKAVFQNFTPIPMIADNEKNWQGGTECIDGIIHYRWGTPDQESAPSVAHEYMHALIQRGFIPSGTKLYNGQCDRKSEDFEADFRKLWDNYRHDEIFDYRLRAALEKYK